MDGVPICCFDFETGSKSPLKTQPIQLSAVMIDSIRLEVIEDSIFDTYIQAIEDPDECECLEIDLVQDEALNVNHITWEQIRGGVGLKQAWTNFTEYVSSYAKKKGDWDKPIRAGYNIVNFDNKIVDRLCVQYGPWDETWCTQKIFHPIHQYDMMMIVRQMTEGQNFRSVSMDKVREWWGINPEYAHNSKKDVLDNAFGIIKFLKLYRSQFGKIKWEKCFERENELIAKAMAK
jgi:inhibitor of KinA sporulation pathway (predicted exonuclease)